MKKALTILVGLWVGALCVHASEAFLSEQVKLTKVSDYAATATTAVTSTAVDMQGYDSVLFITSIGTAATTNTMHVEGGQDNTNFTDMASTDLSVGSSDEDLWIDVKGTTNRYMRVVVDRDKTTTCESIWAIQYDARSVPVDNTTAGTIYGEKHVRPIAGTK